MSLSHIVIVTRNFESYNLYGTNQNMVLSEFVVQDEIIMDGNVKQVEDHQPHEE